MLEDTIINWFAENYPCKNHVPAAFRNKFSFVDLQFFWSNRDTWSTYQPVANTDRSILMLKRNLDRFCLDLREEQAGFAAQAVQSGIDSEDRQIAYQILQKHKIWTNRFLDEYKEDDAPEYKEVKLALIKISREADTMPDWIKEWARVQSGIDATTKGFYRWDEKLDPALVAQWTKENILATLGDTSLSPLDITKLSKHEIALFRSTGDLPPAEEEI